MKDKFCLDSVASFKDINQSSINNSKTKATFSFGKNPRFEEYRPTCTKSTYGGDFQLHKISGAGIGYGTRSDFTKDLTVSPSCTQYKLRTNFQENKDRMRGSSLGLSRDSVKFNQYISKETLKTPAPCVYEHQKINKYASLAFSMRQRTKLKDRSMTLDPQKYNPGPGTYHEPKDPKVSKYTNLSYGVSKSNRFLSSENGIPGAGQYKNEEPISTVGKYNTSKHFGGTQAKFGRSQRKTFFDETITKAKTKPGPGNYKSPSQFGQYDGDVYSQTAFGRFSKHER